MSAIRWFVDGSSPRPASRRCRRRPAGPGAGGGAKRHDHAGALSGFKSQGFDGQGYNQLVADDTDRMGRMQMATTHAATQLNIGH